MVNEDKGCSYGQVIDNRVSTLEREMNMVKVKLDEIRDKLLQRPSWAVTVVIAFLSCVASGSLLLLIKTLSK